MLDMPEGSANSPALGAGELAACRPNPATAEGETVEAKLMRFLFWFAAEFVLYALIVANGRAFVQANYGWTVATDMLISGFNFGFAVKFLNDKDNQDRWSLAGCVLGGATGSVCSIAVTKWLYGS